MTAFYSWRLIYKTFHGSAARPASLRGSAREPAGDPHSARRAGGRARSSRALPFKELFAGHEVERFLPRVAQVQAGQPHPRGHAPRAAIAIAWLPTVMMAARYRGHLHLTSAGRTSAPARRQHEGLYRSLLNKWYFDELYDDPPCPPALWLGRFLWKRGDGWVIDGFGPDGVSARVLDVTRSVVGSRPVTLSHAFAMLIGVAALITWFMFGRGRADGELADPFRHHLPAARRRPVHHDAGVARASPEKRNARWVALWTTLVTFAVSLALVWRFDPARRNSNSSRGGRGSAAPEPITWGSTASRCRS